MQITAAEARKHRANERGKQIVKESILNKTNAAILIGGLAFRQYMKKQFLG